MCTTLFSVHQEPPNMTFREILLAYRAHCCAESVHTPQATAEREFTFNLFCEWKPDPAQSPIGDWNIQDAKRHHLRDFISSFTNPQVIEGRRFRGWTSSSTRKGKANQINAALNWAVAEERIERNPFKGIRYDEAPPRPAMPDEVLVKFLAAANKRFERAVKFLRLCGGRLGAAVCQLRWEWLWWHKAGTLEIGGGGQPRLPDPMPSAAEWFALVPPDQHKSGHTTGKHLTIPLVEEAVDLLRKVQAEDYQPGEIFRNNRNLPWTRGALSYQLRRMKKRLGIDCPASLHGIRHQVGTQSIRNGAALTYVSKGLGHRSTVVTERFYVHVDQDVNQMREALKKGLPERR